MRSRRQRADDVVERQREVVRLERPRRMIRAAVVSGGWPQRAAIAGPLARPSRQSAWNGHDPGNGSARPVVRHPHVPHLGVHQPAQRPPADQPAAADAGADGDVDDRVEPLRRAPAPFAQRGGVHVGVDRHRHAERRGAARRRCRCRPSPAWASR